MNTRTNVTCDTNRYSVIVNANDGEAQTVIMSSPMQSGLTSVCIVHTDCDSPVKLNVIGTVPHDRVVPMVRHALAELGYGPVDTTFILKTMEANDNV